MNERPVIVAAIAASQRAEILSAPNPERAD
jgi:hypothetical protein